MGAMRVCLGKRWALAVCGSVLSLVAVGGVSAARGQASDAPGVAPLEAATADDPPLPLAGFWPTERMIELILNRATQGLAGGYELDEMQTEELREQVVSRWPEFLKKHRRVIQPLINEVIEARLEDRPPDVKTVKGWSERALPMFRTVRMELKQAVQEFRGILGPEQQRRLDRQSVMFDVGLAMAESTLDRWHKGNFNEGEWWDPPIPAEFIWGDAAAAGRRRPDPDRRGRPGRGRAPNAEIEIVPLDDWEAFVVVFIEQHGLDSAQRTTATSILDDLKKVAQSYRGAHQDEFDALAGRLGQAPAEDRPVLRQQQREIYRPIDDLFIELKHRLDNLLMPAQRQAAGDPPPPRRPR